MVDPDDIAPILVAQALTDLYRVGQTLAEPHRVYDLWFDMVLTCLRYQQLPGRPIEDVFIACARRLAEDVRLGS